jgi:uncharacterized protein YukE
LENKPMTDLRLDTEDLHGTAARLGTIVTSLENTMGLSVATATHVGHDLLGAAVVGYAAVWSANRLNMIDAIDTVRTGVDDIATQFDDVDAQLASGLEG